MKFKKDPAIFIVIVTGFAFDSITRPVLSIIATAKVAVGA